MKKNISTLFVFLVAVSSIYAQDESSIKPEAKNWTAEVNLNPFSSSPVNIRYLRFRHFTSDNKAFRMGISFDYQSDKPADDEKVSATFVNLRPGFEKHFKGTERLSPYYGVDLDIAFKTSKGEFGDDNVTTVKGAWSNSGVERGFTRLGANLIFGADYYFAKRFYVGTEFGFGFENIKDADIEVDFPGNQTNPEAIKGGSSFRIGPNFNSSIRLGFVF
ncbi:MAG: hypothetical protein J0L67_12890 [Cytophagales bacterium]|nr:hypothetical protein [Cytophagales bacterium]